MKTLILILVLFSPSLFAAKLQEDLNGNVVLTDDQVKQVIKTFIGDHWFGAYVYDGEGSEEKIGYMHYEFSKDNSFLGYSNPVFIEEVEIHMELFTGESSDVIKSYSKRVFQAETPYNFLWGENTDTQGGSALMITSSKKNDSMEVIRSDGVNVEKKLINNFDYRLNYFLADNIFILQDISTSIGTSIRLLVYEAGEFTNATMTFTDIEEVVTEGVHFKYFIFDLSWEDDQFPVSGQIITDQNMKPILFNFETMQLVARLEDEVLAKDINKKFDFFIANTISVDQNIYENTEQHSDTYPKHIVLEIKGNYNNQFTNSYNQHNFNIESGNFLGLGETFSNFEEATDNDIKENLKKKEFDPIDDPMIIGLAKKATKGVTDISEKIENLLTFVSNYIEDTYQLGSTTTVYDIIERKAGDCSEHAFLFNVLARSIGIPSRQVSGYALDFESNTFGGHAWNEVVIDGYWIAVDPTWDGIPLFTHIKTDELLNPLMNNINFKLDSIEYENGEKKLF